MMGSYFPSLYAYLRYRPIVSLTALSSAIGAGYFAPIYYDSYQRRHLQALNSSSFTPFTLIAKHRISTSSSIFVLRPPQNSSAAEQLKEVWDTDSLWSVQAKQPQLQIGHEYTPIPPTAVLGEQSPKPEDGNADIHLLIRREKNGEMTTYLHGLQPPTATVHLRGPYQDVKLPKHVDEVLFIAGGTGISPALQVAQIMSRRPGAKVTILWANRRREECVQAPISKDSVISPGWWTSLKNTIVGSEKSTVQEKEAIREGTAHEEKGLMVRILEEMQQKTHDGNLRVEYFIDEEDSFIKHTDVRKILSRSEADSTAAAREALIKPPSTKSTSAAEALLIPVPGTQIASAATRESTHAIPQPKSGAKLILVSGPNGFVDYWAGKKRMKDGNEIQGPLGGALGEMELHGWKVWKL